MNSIVKKYPMDSAECAVQSSIRARCKLRFVRGANLESCGVRGANFDSCGVLTWNRAECAVQTSIRARCKP